MRSHKNNAWMKSLFAFSWPQVIDNLWNLTKEPKNENANNLVAGNENPLKLQGWLSLDWVHSPHKTSNFHLVARGAPAWNLIVTQWWWTKTLLRGGMTHLRGPTSSSSGHVFFAFDSFMVLVVLHPSYTTLSALNIVEFAGVPTNFKMTHGIFFSSSG